jgi:hypothetical protein
MSRSTWSSPEYIDRFAWTSRHEVKHVSDDSAMWGATTDRNILEDYDVDWIKDADEETYYRGYNDWTTFTYADTVSYGLDPIPDYEDVCMRSHTSPYGVDTLWTNGTANSVDWASPGKQY